MDSSPAGAAGLGRPLLGEAYLWLLPAALGLGLGLALLLRALRARARGEEGRAARLSAGALVLLSLAFLAGAGLAVFPPKAELSSPLLLGSGVAFLALGLGGGIFPRALGLPLLILGLGAAALLASALAGFEPRRGPGELARLLPLSSEGGLIRAELELAGPAKGSRQRKVELPFEEAGLVVEFLELEGPLRLLGGGSFRRVAGLAGPGGAILALEPAAGLLDRLLPLPEGGSASAALPLARRRRETSELRPLLALDPLLFSLAPRPGGGLGLEARGPAFASD